jgi:pimeloyl-ACP methyl ester carboxylesterase
MVRSVAAIVALAACALNAQQPSARLPVLETFVEGSGRTVVFLDGGIYGVVAFEPHARLLRPDFRVVRADTLAFERARKQAPLPSGYSLDMESEALARALDARGITGPVDVVAASFSALIALDFALDHPKRVRTLTLFEPLVFWAMPAAMISSDAGLTALIEVIRELGPDAEPTDAHVSAFMCALGVCGEERPDDGTTELKMWESHRASLRGLSAVVNHRDSLDRLKTLTMPVLLMTGTSSVGFHRRINDELATRLPRLERGEVTGDHTAPLTARDEFLAKWREFLEKH